MQTAGSAPTARITATRPTFMTRYGGVLPVNGSLWDDARTRPAAPHARDTHYVPPTSVITEKGNRRPRMHVRPTSPSRLL